MSNAADDPRSILYDRNQLLARIRDLEGRLESEAFWKWLYHTCPSGVSDPMRNLWLASAEYRACNATNTAQPIAWSEWRETLAKKVDAYIQKQSDGDDDDGLEDDYRALKNHILATPFAIPAAAPEQPAQSVMTFEQWQTKHSPNSGAYDIVLQAEGWDAAIQFANASKDAP